LQLPVNSYHWQLANVIERKIKTKTPFGIHPKGVFYIIFNK